MKSCIRAGRMNTGTPRRARSGSTAPAPNGPTTCGSIQEADAAILDVVDATPDISIDEYIAIGEAAAADPDLAARIDARFAEAFSE
jgi:hypothetical protein